MKTLDIFKKIRKIQIQTTRLATDVLAGQYHSIFKGKGIEFEEVREYQPGDEIRSIDWNVTARMNHPYVKSYREERELSVMLLVDVSASSHFGSSELSKAELIAELGGVLSFSAIKNNDRIGLILFSDQVEKYIPPNKGTRHVLRLIRELLLFKPKSRGTDLNAALKFYGHIQRQTGICFVISDFIASDYAHEMTLLSKKHDLITIRVTDPFEMTLPTTEMLHLCDLETGQTHIVDPSNSAVQEQLKRSQEKRALYHKELIKKTGIGHLEIQTTQSYLPLLQNFFKYREKARQ